MRREVLASSHADQASAPAMTRASRARVAIVVMLERAGCRRRHLTPRSEREGSGVCLSGQFVRWRSMSSWSSCAALVTPCGVRFEAAADDRFHGRGDRPVRAAEPGRRPLASLDELIDQVRAVTPRARRGPMPRQQLEEDDPQRIEVAPPVDLSRRASIRLELLGRHVAGGPTDPGVGARFFRSIDRLKSRSIGSPSSVNKMLAGFRSRWRIDRSCAWASPLASREPTQRTAWTYVRPSRYFKVRVPGRSLLVGWRAVAMHRRDAARLPVGHPLGVTGRRESLPRPAVDQGTDQAETRLGQGALTLQARADVLQRRRAEERHANNLRGFHAVDGIDRDDIRVLQPGEELRFGVEGRGDLEHDRAVRQALLAGEIDGPEGARAQHVDELESQELLADVVASADRRGARGADRAARRFVGPVRSARRPVSFRTATGGPPEAPALALRGNPGQPALSATRVTGCSVRFS